MSAEVSVTITPDLHALTSKLVAEGKDGKTIKNALAKQMRQIGDKAVEFEKESIAGTTIRGVKGSSRGGKERVKRGGRGRGSGKGIRGPIANAIKKRNRLTASKSTGAGIEIRVSQSAMPEGLERVPWWTDRKGSWRHPIFGNKNAWAQQNAHPTGWFTRGAKRAEPMARAGIIAAMQEAESKWAAEFGGSN